MAKTIPLTPVVAPPRTTDDILAEIKQIYFTTSRSTILRDFDRAIDLLKTIPTVEERQRAAVYMDGLAEMRREFGATGKKPDGSGPARASAKKRHRRNRRR